jgi:hypothetical protein
MSMIAETISEMVDVARDIGASLVRLIGGVQTPPLDSADVSGLSELKARERRNQNNAHDESARNADAR